VKKVKKLKKIIFLFVLLFLIQNAFSICDDYTVEISYVDNSENCINEFNAVFKDTSCDTEPCFLEASTFEIYLNEKSYDLPKSDGKIFLAVVPNKNCDNDNVILRIYDADNNSCVEDSFSLKTELEEWINPTNNTVDDNYTFVEDNNTLKQEIIQRNNNDINNNDNDINSDEDKPKPVVPTISKNAKDSLKENLEVYREVRNTNESLNNTNYVNRNPSSSSFPIIKIVLGVLSVIIVLSFAGFTYYVLSHKKKKNSKTKSKK
jgi:hypothetical protein